MSAQPARVIAILGMHRSGTSCLTGSLQEAGLDLGDCHTWNPYNLKGNRENQAFVDLHDSILAANGGAWDDPPAACDWQQQHREVACGLLASHAHLPVLGFKDPRALLVLEGWKTLLPNLEYVGIFRHPDAVARSLHNRSRMPREQALSLWYAYNCVLFREFRRLRFPLLCFDEEEALFTAKVDTVIDRLQLQRPAHPQRFYDNELRNYTAADSGRLPWRVRWLYYRLRRASL
ncbi:MAG: hypothetical protein RJQ10_16775 [Haliea sp.]|uniref:hypothetical protein n=1 Tax=Haliea sp. TaxID=1932666 RepID=UPI0032EEDB6E